MGVKSTVKMTRQNAVTRLTDLKLKEVTRAFMFDVFAMSNTEIEDELERLEDKWAGGESFMNFIVVDE